jgi:NADH:ubiquinone oxidoreductase subunit F (NADH-binding)/ferredoxin
MKPTDLFSKEWLIKRILLDTSESLSSEENEMLALLRHDIVEQPVIYIGTSSCGVVAGALKTLDAIKKYLEKHKIETRIVEVGCIGLCSAEPIVDIQLPGKPRLSFSNVMPSDVEILLGDLLHHTVPANNIIGQFRSKLHEPWSNVQFIDEHPFFKYQKRIVLINCGISDPINIEEYIAKGGYRSYLKAITSYTPEKVCQIVDKSGLRGRGGRGFYVGAKWKIAREHSSDQRYLICNCDESDPGAFMNRSVIESDPHLVIEGIAIAAYAIGATKAYIHIRKAYEKAIEQMTIALEQASKYGLTGNNILGSGVNMNIVLRSSAGAYISGEETALIRSIEGKRATPNHKPPFPTQIGLFEKPTVVNNVETLATLPAIFNMGPQWYAEHGTASSKGTKVFSISGRVKNIGLIEIPFGLSLKQVVFDIAGGTKDNKVFKALHLGGPSGFSLPENMLDTVIDFEELEKQGLSIGLGGMVVMDEDTCMVDVARFFIHFMKKESCGKCIPCREGSRRMSDIIDNITRNLSYETSFETLERFKGVMQLEEMAEIIKITSLCGLGKSAPNPILSTLKWFREEYEEHIFDRKCRAGVCQSLRKYYIDADKCTGCTACESKCPTNAIFGTPLNPYYIIEEKCIGCGICYDVCRFSAIFVK